MLPSIFSTCKRLSIQVCRWLLGLPTSKSKEKQFERPNFVQDRYALRSDYLLLLSAGIYFTVIINFGYCLPRSLPESFLREDDVSYLPFSLCLCIFILRFKKRL